MPDDKILDIALIKMGDQQAWEVVKAVFGPPMCRYVDRWLRNPADAEDIVQAMLARASLCRGQFRGDTQHQLYGWMRTIARRLVFEELRKRQRRKTQPMPPTLDPSDEGAQACAIQRRALKGERARLREHLQALPPHLREVIVLHTIRGLSFPEVAARLRIPVGTA